jgi:nucleotide-binding universal stress UspA family protein
MTRFGVPPGCVVVGIDGSADSARALTWAAGQATVEHRPLAIVHCTQYIALRDTPWLDGQGIDHRQLTAALDEAARQMLAQACERAGSVAPGVEVVTAVVGQDPRSALEELSIEAHLLVLGSRGLGPLRSALLGSVSASVTRHAACPVIVCRPTDDPRTTAERIVVGADGCAASLPVLEFAFAQASLVGLPLTVMHCFWDVTAATRGPGVVAAEDQDELPDLRLLLAESVAGLAEKYPDVQVTRELARGLVDECLGDRTPDAALVVVGRATAHRWDRFLHASCALAVLERARTAVAVVPEAP